MIELLHFSDRVCRLTRTHCHDFITDALPVIQGTADVSGKLTQAEVSKTLDFCLHAFQETAPEQREAVLQKVEDMERKTKEKGKFDANLSDEEHRVLKSIRARQMLRTEDILRIDNFSADTIDGFAPHLQRGSLGLVKAMPPVAVKESVKQEQAGIPIKAY